MQVYDLIMLGVLVFATLFGAWKGLAWQVASIASIVVSFFVACQFREPMAAVLPAQSPWNKFLAMLILFLGCSLLIWIVFRFVSDIINRVKLKEFDRHAGAVLGFGRGVLWCVIITLFAVTLLDQAKQQAVIQSRSGHYIALLLDRADAVMPDELRQVLAPYIHSLDERLDSRHRLTQRPDSGGATEGRAADDSGSGSWPLSIGGGQEKPDGNNSDDAIQRWLNRLPQQP
jgi:membrane protein required for colicin V production